MSFDCKSHDFPNRHCPECHDILRTQLAAKTNECDGLRRMMDSRPLPAPSAEAGTGSEGEGENALAPSPSVERELEKALNWCESGYSRRSRLIASAYRRLREELAVERKAVEAWHLGHWKADMEAVKSYKDIAASSIEHAEKAESDLAQARKDLEAMTKWRDAAQSCVEALAIERERLREGTATILRWLMSVKRLDPDVEGLDAVTLLAAALAPRDEKPATKEFDGEGCRHVDGICARVGFPGHVKPEDF